VRRMDEVRIVEHPEPGEICLRPGRRPAWDVLQVVVFACAVLPLCAIWARDAFVVFGLGSLFLIVTRGLIYLRGGIWVTRSAVRVQAISNAAHFSPNQVLGIGTLRAPGWYRDHDRELAILIADRWVACPGVRGPAVALTAAALRLSKATGWPVAKSPLKVKAAAEIRQSLGL